MCDSFSNVMELVREVYQVPIAGAARSSSYKKTQFSLKSLLKSMFPSLGIQQRIIKC